MNRPKFFLGAQLALTGKGPVSQMHLPAHHLVTHGCIVGMTGSGKSGLLTVVMEEALRAGVGVITFDLKGDGVNLLVRPSLDAAALEPHVQESDHASENQALAQSLAAERRAGLESFGLGEAELTDYRQRTHIRVITPGSEAGELLNVTSSLSRRSAQWDHDVESARASLSATVSLIMRVLGRDADPARSREHVLVSVLAERRFMAGKTADLPDLLEEIVEPPMETIGALEIDAFMSKKARRELAAGLNTLLASPSFASWRQGAPLDVASWLKPVDGRTPATIISVAHLDDEERTLILGIILEEILSYVRSLRGSRNLKSLIVFDEVYGFLPPHPASPPTKRPLVALMKQARAFGVGVLLATQNPMDLDYRALSNAGLWCLGRLQTDADRERVLDGIANEAGQGETAEELGAILKALKPRWFVVRDAHGDGSSVLLNPRWTMTFMRGPMTRQEIREARGATPREDGLGARPDAGRSGE